jgi:hypothetical protein
MVPRFHCGSEWQMGLLKDGEAKRFIHPRRLIKTTLPIHEVYFESAYPTFSFAVNRICRLYSLTQTPLLKTWHLPLSLLFSIPFTRQYYLLANLFSPLD